MYAPEVQRRRKKQMLLGDIQGIKIIGCMETDGDIGHKRRSFQRGEDVHFKEVKSKGRMFQ